MAEARHYTEVLDSVRFDGDIDLDREKTREQLGFKDSPETGRKTFSSVLKNAEERSKQFHQSNNHTPERTHEKEGM